MANCHVAQHNVKFNTIQQLVEGFAFDSFHLSIELCLDFRTFTFRACVACNCHHQVMTDIMTVIHGNPLAKVIKTQR